MKSDLFREAGMNRRSFIGGALGATAVGTVLGALASNAQEPATATLPPKITRKFKLGVVGCGKRGTIVTQHFKDHGGYEIHAVADYFQDEADKFGNTHGVDKSRRFSGLSAYKKLIESGVDIVALEHMPYFFPEQAAAAIAASKHVYMAKPVAVDVPGTLKIGELGKEATRKNLGFIVDYQMPTDPHNIEVRERILAGDLGKLVYVCSYGVANRWPEADAQTPREEYLRHSKWIYHTALSANSCVSFDIHSIDTAMWVIGRRPTVATGFSARSRADAFLDGCDVAQVVLHFDDGLIWTHQHQSLTNQCTLTNEGGLVTKVHGTDASATLTYWGKAMVRGGPKSFARTVENLYPAGIARNVAQFYSDLTAGNFANPTVARSVESNLAAILIREAATRGTRLTMDELLKENKKLEFDTTGFKA